MRIPRLASPLLFIALALIGGWIAAWLLLPDEVAHFSFLVTIKLGIEVTALCLLLGSFPLYAALRQPKWPKLPHVLVAVSLGSLLIPTIARSLSLSALFSFYGPLATGLRVMRLWPQGQPLDSSHAAVVIALVTLYLPFTLLILSESMPSLGRMPDVAGTLGAGVLQTSLRVTIPRLLRPLATAGLVVFSQVLGVIITPRILGSEDVTLAVLIDDLLKRTMNTPEALRIAWAEMALAIPVAAVAAYFIEKERTARARPLQPALRFRGGRVLSVIPLVILAVVPGALLILSLGHSPILSMASLFQSGPTLEWFRRALLEPGFRRVLLPSFMVWMAAAAFSIFPALLVSVLILPYPQVRRSFRLLALVLLFVPQNALGVLLFMVLSRFPAAQASIPAWLLGGMGQAVPGFAFAFLLMDRVGDRLRRSLALASTLGASAWQRLLKVALPNLAPSVAAAFVATALITLDDIIFVRYLPRLPVNTAATELFGRARYGAAPDLAAACILMALFILLLVACGHIARKFPAIRRRLVASVGRPKVAAELGVEGAR